MKLYIIHPGIQHSYHLANGAVRSGFFKKVFLLTSILYKPNQKIPDFLKKRIKPIDNNIYIVNHYLYTFLYTISRYLYNKIFVNPLNQSHNNPTYFWQKVFGLCCLPRLYLNRKNTLIVCFETTGWPVVKYCKKWGIPIIMDFASISHETAKTLGINETNYGINLKIKERSLIDYGFYCSEFCKKSFEGLTSARKDFVLYLGAEKRIEYGVVSSESLEVESLKYKVGSNKYQNAYSVESLENQDASSKKQDVYGVESLENQDASSKKQDADIVESLEENQGGIEIREQREMNQDAFGVEGLKLKVKSEEISSVKISFIANLEYRKGLDIFLESIYAYEYPVILEVHLIGRIRESWVSENMPKNIVNHQVILIYRPAMSQQELFSYLAKEQFDLNVQCSRFDSFAMVVPETMMQGIPNIVSPFVGAGEMITNGVDGFIMKDLASQSLNRILNYYISLSESDRVNLKQHVLESSKNMVWENYYKNLCEVFKEVLKDIK